MTEELEFIPVLVGMVPLILLVVFGLIFFLKSRSNAKSVSDKAKAFSGKGDKMGVVKVKATFGGLSFLPRWVGISHNSLYPRFALTNEGIEYCVLRNRFKHYRDIVEVDYRSSFRSGFIGFKFKDSVMTFSANVGSKTACRNVLIALQAKGVALSSNASQLLLETASD